MSDPTLNTGMPYLAPTRNPFNYSKFEQIDRDNVTPWLTVDEIAQQINLYEDESQDVYLKSLELATRQAIEDYLGLPVMPVTYRVYYSGNSLYGIPLSLDLPQVSSGSTKNNSVYVSKDGIKIDSVGYWNNSTPSVFNVLSSSSYYYDNSGDKVILNNLPSDLNMVMTAPIVLEYTILPSPVAEYPVVKQAALLLYTHLYNNRSNTGTVMMRTIPFGVDALLRPYKPLVI